MLSQFSSKMYMGDPSAEAGFEIYQGSWKYDPKGVGSDSIHSRITQDPRPRWCAENFDGLEGKSVVELGPADGYNSAGLEELGAELTAIEGNVDAFLRCLILKNALNLKAQFALGDFTKMFSIRPKWDLIYGSGVLYHLIDPIGFLDDCSRHCDNLFLWTHYYDKECVDLIDHEKKGFASNITSERLLNGRSFKYYQKKYDTNHVEMLGYIGGLNSNANWLERDDLLAAIESVGFKISNIVDDPFIPGRMPALNIFASK